MRCPYTLYKLDYISDFWSLNSDYVKDYALTEDQPHSGKYLIDNEAVFRLHLKPYEPFQNIPVGELRSEHIRAWMRWAKDNGRSPPNCGNN
jgi:hypothetical protein